MKIRPGVAVVAALVTTVLAATPAFAFGSDTFWMSTVQQLLIQKVKDVATNTLNSRIAQIASDSVKQVTDSYYGVQGEIAKNVIAQKNTAEAIAQYKSQSRLNEQAAVVKEALEPANNVCSSMAMSDVVASVNVRVRVAANSNNRSWTQSFLNPQGAGAASTAAAVVGSYDKSIKKYCTDGDEAVGRCHVAENPNPALAGADVNADLLFGSANDASAATYAAGQADALKDFIRRIVGYAPDALASRSVRDEETPQGRAYADMARRYAAFMSMAAYSLNSIIAAHDVQQ